MTDTRDLLERARRQAPPTCSELDRIRELRERGLGRRRLAATVVGLTVTMTLVAGIHVTLNHRTSPAHESVGGGGPVGPPSVDLSLRHGEYFFLEVEASYPWGQYSTQTWWGSDNSGREIDGAEDRSFEPGRFLGDAGDLTYLSTDPIELDQQLRARVQPDGASPEPYDDWVDSPAGPLPDQEGAITWGLVRSYGDLLLDPNLSPEQRAALFQVAANLQGMSVQTDQSDPQGRPAILLSIETEDQLHEWWFDPESEQLLAMRDSFVTDVGEGPSVIIVRQAGVVSSTDSSNLSRKFIPAA